MFTMGQNYPTHFPFPWEIKVGSQNTMLVWLGPISVPSGISIHTVVLSGSNFVYRRQTEMTISSSTNKMTQPVIILVGLRVINYALL